MSDTPLYKDSPKGVDTGYIGYLTADEETKLAEMKSILTEKSYTWEDDYELLRFLRARKFELTASVDMFTEYKDWYTSENIGQYPATYPPRIEVLAKLIPHAFHGYDKEGHPIYIERSGCLEPPLLTALLTDKQMLTAHLWAQERKIQLCRESEKIRGLPTGSVERFTIIMDLKGLTMGHKACLKFTELISKIDEKYYPERMGYVFIVNPTFSFNFLFGIAKLWIDPVTKGKIVVIKDLEQLKEYIDEDQLATVYGGTAEVAGLADPDLDAVRAQYLTDEEYKSQYQTYNIDAGKRYIHELPVEAGMAYTYCFRCNENIKFSTRFVPEGVKSTDVQACEVVNNEGIMSFEWPNLGCFVAERKGTLILDFYNQNWFGGKVVDLAVVSEKLQHSDVNVDSSAIDPKDYVASNAEDGIVEGLEKLEIA